MTVSKQLIEDVQWLKQSVQQISVYDLNSYSVIELYYNIANKLNEVIREVGRFEGVLSEEVIKQNEKLTYLLGEGMMIEVVKKINQMVIDGTMDFIINHNVFNDFNVKINKLNDNKADKVTTSNLQSQINNLVVHSSGDSNAEVIQARVNVTGVEFGTLSERNLFVENSLNGNSFPISWTAWEEGGINTNTGLDTPVTGYQRTKGFLSFNELKNIKCSVKNCKIVVLEYSKSSKSLLNFAEKTSDFTLLNLQNYFRFVIVPLTGSITVPSNHFTMIGSYSFIEIENIKTLSSPIPSILDSCNNYLGDVSLKEMLKWEIGGITGNTGVNTDVDYAIRSDFFQFNTNVEITYPKDFYCLSYNQNMEFIERINPTLNKLTLKDLTKIYRFVFSNGSGNPISDITNVIRFIEIKSTSKFREKVLEVVDNNNILESSLKGKMINLLGDSITSTDYTTPTWWQKIATKTGAKFNNYGISGTCVSYNEDRENRFGKCFANRYKDMNIIADCVVVMGGTNDYEAKLGTWYDTQNNTFYGALNILMKGLLEDYKGKPIIFMTPIQQANDYLTNVADPLSIVKNGSSSTVSLQLRSEAIKLKCKQYGITFIDLFNQSGINGVDSLKTYYRNDDVTHPSSKGHNVIANELLSVLENKFKIGE